MWELKDQEGWAPKHWCFRNCVKTLESPLDCKEIKPVNFKGNKPWIFIRRTDAEAPPLWPPDAKSCLTGKDPDAGKDWEQEKKGATEDEGVGWHHQLNGHELSKSGRWCRTGKPVVLPSTESQRVKHDLMTKQQQQYIKLITKKDLWTLLNTL